MLLNSFKVGAFKVFGEVVELKMKAESRNTTRLSSNVITNKVNGLITKNVKSALIYGGNNTGKTSVLEAILTMKKIFVVGDVYKFPFVLFKNFCYGHDEVIRFEIDFNDEYDNIVYGIEFADENILGEYLYVNDELLLSRALDGELEGAYFEDAEFRKTVSNLPTNKLIVPYFLEYQKSAVSYAPFIALKTFFAKINFVDNRLNVLDFKLMASFITNERKMRVFNTLVNSTELYMHGRTLVSEQEVIAEESFRKLFDEELIAEHVKTDDGKENFKALLANMRITSVYEGQDGVHVHKPSLFFDSVGTNKFLNLALIVINALFNGEILLVDEFDSSLHHKLTRQIVILMNSEANTKAQFILTTHDVNLLSSDLFRKDQINFITRDKTGVALVSLDEYKANSDTDIRNTSNFEKMYVEEKIVPLPDTNIYNVIKEIIHG